MKKMIQTVVAIVVLSITAKQINAQDFSALLNEAYKTLESATTTAGMMSANNKFNLIAVKWSKEWAANYYAAYSNICISFKESDAKRKDQLLDEADKYMVKANSIHPPGDESMVLAAYLAYGRYSVDPANRWGKYLNVMNSNLENAKKINPNNPRIYYLDGIPEFNKPKIYGGGKDKAKPYFEKAKQLFAKQDTSSITKPFWGEKDNLDYLAKCSE